MPETRIPEDHDAALDLVLASMMESADGPANKAASETSSVRAASPKSDGGGSSVSELSEGSLGSLEFPGDEEEEDCRQQQDILVEELAALKVEEEEEADERAREGADVRHVLQTSWKLQSKYPVGKKILNNKSSGLNKTAPGAALREMAEAQKMAIEEHERIARLFKPARSSRRQQADRPELMPVVQPDTMPPILVSYADGSNTLTLANEPLCIHNITVSCAVDSCHMFIQQAANPTFAGLAPLEDDMAAVYAATDATDAPLLRPIATGSLLAVFSDDKWYRCQVVAFDARHDTCEVKFVDHGGYTTVHVDQLRQLRSDFVQLPFQALEVYIAHIGPAKDEVVIDIASDILFRKRVSLQLCGFAEDGTAVVQAYFYHRDYIHLFDQYVLDDATRVFMENHPEYVAQPTPSSLMSDTSSEYCESVAAAGDTGSVDLDYSDEGVWSDEVEAASIAPSPVAFYSQEHSVSHLQASPDQVYASPGQASPDLVYGSPDPSLSPELAIYSPSEQIPPEFVSEPVIQAPTPVAPVIFAAPAVDPNGIQYGDVTWVSYYVTDPMTGACYLATAPLVPVTDPVAAYPYMANDTTVGNGVEQQTEEAEHQQEEEEADRQSKPVEDWTQDDYERYYHH